VTASGWLVEQQLQCLVHALRVLEVGRWPGRPLEEGLLALLTPALEESAHRLVTHAQVTCDVRCTPAFGGKQDPPHPVPLVSIHIRGAADVPQPLGGGQYLCPGA